MAINLKPLHIYVKEVVANARMCIKDEVKDDWDGVWDFSKRKVVRGHHRVWDKRLTNCSLAGQPQDRIKKSRFRRHCHSGRGHGNWGCLEVDCQQQKE